MTPIIHSLRSPLVPFILTTALATGLALAAWSARAASPVIVVVPISITTAPTPAQPVVVPGWCWGWGYDWRGSSIDPRPCCGWR